VDPRVEPRRRLLDEEREAAAPEARREVRGLVAVAEEDVEGERPAERARGVDRRVESDADRRVGSDVPDARAAGRQAELRVMRWGRDRLRVHELRAEVRDVEDPQRTDVAREVEHQPVLRRRDVRCLGKPKHERGDGRRRESPLDAHAGAVLCGADLGRSSPRRGRRAQGTLPHTAT